jgi:hypothetical protein
MAKHTGIAVLESRWWNNSNTSVRGLFELIADINNDNPHAYEYEMANCEVAVKEAIPRIAANKKCKYLCIATHGDKDGLRLHNDERISRTELRNILESINNTSGSRFHGVHMSSCIFGTQTLADFVFEKSVSPNWISGYSTKVNFLDSSAMDLLFFNELVGKAIAGESPNKAIMRTAKRLKVLAGGLVEQLGFGIYVRKQRVGGAKNLLS